MPLELYLAYVLACAVITLIPGPTVTVIIANSLAHGTRAGLLNVAGTQLGLGLMMAILVVGLSSVIAAMGLALRLAALGRRHLSRLAGLEAAAHARCSS
jgi:homoserine/homoserine lactone efflux protein